jgi:hypothetical protein
MDSSADVDSSSPVVVGPSEGAAAKRSSGASSDSAKLGGGSVESSTLFLANLAAALPLQQLHDSTKSGSSTTKVSEYQAPTPPVPTWDLALFGSDAEVGVSGNGRIVRCVCCACAKARVLPFLLTYSHVWAGPLPSRHSRIGHAGQGKATLGTSAKFEAPGVHHFVVAVR